MAYVLKLPVRLERVVRWNQRALPAARIFVAAAVLGLGIGLALYFTLDWVWWPFPLLAVLLAWVAFATTAFRPAGRRRRTMSELADQIDWTFRPSRARDRSFDRIAKRYVAAEYPLYGLPQAWEGLRYFGGSAEDEHRTTMLGLTHQPQGLDGPRLDVQSHRGDIARPDLEHEVWMQAHDRMDEEPESLDRPWSTLTVQLDGQPAEFELTRENDKWWAFRQLDAHYIVLHGENYPADGVELVRVTDLTPYREGLARMFEQR